MRNHLACVEVTLSLFPAIFHLAPNYPDLVKREYGPARAYFIWGYTLRVGREMIKKNMDPLTHGNIQRFFLVNSFILLDRFKITAWPNN